MRSKQSKSIVFVFVLTLFCINPIHGFSQYVGQFSAEETIKPKIDVKAYSFDLSDVRLLDSRFKENMERDGKWLLSIRNITRHSYCVLSITTGCSTVGALTQECALMPVRLEAGKDWMLNYAVIQWAMCFQVCR